MGHEGYLPPPPPQKKKKKKKNGGKTQIDIVVPYFTNMS